MAGLDVASAAVGIASFGIQVCQGLLSYYDGWKSYKSDIGGAYEAILDLSETLGLLRDSLKHRAVDTEGTERVQTCLRSCEEGLTKLSAKLQELQKFTSPEGLRQKVLSEAQRMWYPLRADTLSKLQKNVVDVQGRLELALQVLQLNTTASIECSVALLSVQQQSILAAQESDRFQQLVDWLSPPDPWTNHDSARQRREAQTGNWLLQSDQYQRWKTGSTRHAWIYGKAGCGKTVLCSTLIEDVRSFSQDESNVALAAFYFTFSDGQKQTYQNLLRSLVAQLGMKEPALSMLGRAYQDRNVPGEEELEKILHCAMEKFDEVFLLLDAIDESPEENDVRQYMLERIETLAQRAKNLKIFATSREVRDIRETMERLQADQVVVAARAVDADIQQYLSGEMSRDRRLARLDSKSKAAIEETILQKADGMFRWAYCQLQELKNLKSTKPKYIRETLRALPMTLDATYARMLTGIAPMFRDEALTLLRWLAYARSPLTLAELAESAIIDPLSDDDGVDVDNRGDLEDTLEILSGLVTLVGSSEDGPRNKGAIPIVPGIEDDDAEIMVRGSWDITGRTKIRLAHFSVKEYLESQRILESDARAFHLQSEAGHRFIAQSCITYIIHYSKSEDKASTRKDFHTFPLIAYAAREWYYHLSLQKHEEVSLEVSFLSSEQVLKAWLLVHQPDRRWGQPFGDIEDVNSGLYYACYVGLGTLVKILLQRGQDVNAQGGYYGNALQAAVVRGCVDTVELLLDIGAAVNTSGGTHGNALQAASCKGHEHLVKSLLDKGADVNAQGGYHGNALQSASHYGHDRVVRQLLDSGADVNAQGGDFGNALQSASHSGNENCVKLLLDKGADVNAQGGYLDSALQSASFRGHKHIVQLLLDNGADINLRGGHFGNALQVASRQGHREVVGLLILEGAHVNAQAGFYGYAIQAASAFGYIEVVKILLLENADVNARGGHFDNALQVASAEGYTDLVKLLLLHGADVNAQGGPYINALRAASITGHAEVVKLLRDWGALEDDGPK